MQKEIMSILILSILLLVSLTTMASADENTLTFVLGTSENQQSLANASLTSESNILIYDYQSAPDLSNNSFVFLGSINDSNISLSVNTSAVIWGYNMTNTSLINTDDNNITKYWVYGGDDNIANMIDYMENQYLGYSSTEYETPLPPEDRINVTVITGGSGSKGGLLSANDDALISKYVRVNVIETSEEPLSCLTSGSMVTEDIIVLQMIGVTWINAAKEVSTEAMEQNNATVLCMQTDALEGFGTINESSEEFATCEQYWEYKGEENMRRLIVFLAATYKDAPLEILDPVERVHYGIYHPDAPEIYQTTEEYLEWYASTGKYNPDNITIGIIEYQVPTEKLTSKVEDALIEEIESRGCNAMFTSFYKKDPNSLEYFIVNNTSMVDAVISLRSYSLGQADTDLTSEMVLEFFEELNVPVLHGSSCYYSTSGSTYKGSQEDWENSSIGMSSGDIARQIVLPEFDGIFDSIILSWKNKNEDGTSYNVEPLEDHVEWLVSRCINNAKLGETPNSEKKVAILYYNHGGGKNNFYSMYLDVPESLSNVVTAMGDAGYDVGTEPIPNETELLDLMVLQGRNIGTWAPGELDKMVESGKVVLWPTEEYMEWFSALPEENQEDVIDQWGPAPGEIMVYENDSGSYFVLPRIEFGNVILGPQPLRGWEQDNEALYHNTSLVPPHQYIAYYFWLQHEYEADAIVHFGTHGTQEWLPGKDVALSMYDWPAVMAGEVPIVYPYIMDDVGEGIQAKRRGNALIVDHMTSPLIEAGLYGGYANLSDYITQYNDVSNSDVVKDECKNLILEEYSELSLVDALLVNSSELTNMSDAEFDYFLEDTLEVYLDSIETASMPYGMHVIGENPPEEQSVGMVRLMLGSDYIDHVETISNSENASTLLLEEVILNGTSIEDAQNQIMGFTDENVTTYIELGEVYYQSILDSIRETENILRALNGEYIEPDSGNDPIRSPGSLPTGIDFYSVNPQYLPGYTEWLAGKSIANQTIEMYQEDHDGEYPDTIAYVAFSTELIRNKGVTESEVLYMLGVEPGWDDKGRIKLSEFRLIPESELGRPRIDILYTASGLYRDMYPDKLEMIDYAVRLAANAENSTYPNYVKQHSEEIYDQLIAHNYTEEDAKLLSESRVVSRQAGVYGTGLEATIGASETWDNESVLAEMYIDNLGNFYGVDIWDETNTDVFKAILGTVDIAIKSDSSNCLDLLDNDDFVAWHGGLALAVRSVTGSTPEMYVTNLIDSDNMYVETLSTMLNRELAARYNNPNWIQGMMESGFAGASQIDRLVEFLWMWEVTTPDIVTDSNWNQIYNTYILDENNLGLEEFFNENPYNYQSITAQMLEVARKEGWGASEEQLQTLVKEYVESVVNDGVTCCHHTCGNPLLDDFIQGNMQAAGLSQEMQDAYKQLMYEATLREDVQIQQPETDSNKVKDDSGNSITRAMASGSGASNQTMMADSGGAGMNLDSAVQDSAKTTPDNYVEGYEMTKESVTNTDSTNSPSFSSSDIVASVFVIAGVGAIYLGFWRRRKF